MEKESRFFKTPEEMPEKSEEMRPAEEKPKTESEAVALSPEEEEIKAEFAAEQKENREKEGFLGKMQKGEQDMSTGILRKITEASPRLRKAIMVLATAGILLSAGKAFAGGERRVYQGWQTPVRWGEKSDFNRQMADRQRFEAYRSYQQQAEALQKVYEQRKFDIMIGRLPGATDYFGKQKAYEELEQWKNNELSRTRYDWSMKVWAAEEEHRVKSGQIRR